MNEAQPLVLPAGVVARPIQLDAPRTYHLPHWGQMSDPARLAFLRSVATQRGRDPRIRELVFRLVAGVPERDYPRQAAAILKAVQPGGPLMAYVNEPGEVLQDPLYTLKVRAGDCDDAATLLATLFEAVRLPWRFVLSGEYLHTMQRDARGVPIPGTGKRVRWVEGTPYPRGVRWGHIYTCVGWPVFAPTTWAWAEPTVRHAPLGWDVLSHLERTGKVVLPELGATPTSTVAAAGGATAAATSQRTLVETILLGVVTTVAATVAIDWLRARRVISAPK